MINIVLILAILTQQGFTQKSIPLAGTTTQPFDLWCTVDGYRVSPTGSGHFDSSKLHRPQVEKLRSGHEIEFCRKIERVHSRANATVYFSARISRKNKLILARDIIIIDKTGKIFTVKGK